MRYAKSTNGFYDEVIHGENIPADSVEITKQAYVAILAAQSSGQRIEADSNGHPVAVVRTPNLADAKAEKLAALDADRKRLETLPITGNQGGKLFTISRPEKVNEFLMGGLQIALDPSPAASFTMLDDNGVSVTYTKVLMGQIIGFINSSKAPALGRYAARKAAIEAATTAAEVEAVNTNLMVA